MKLREYLELLEPGTELTCWDNIVDSEFYFYSKDEDWEPEEDEYQVVDVCMDKLAAMLDVVKIHERGVEVNLYDMLDHPRVIQYAKDNFYSPRQYEDNDDLVMLLFDDNTSNISNGFVHFSGQMVECLEQAYGLVGEKYQISQIKELEKHLDDIEHVRVGIAKMGIALDKFVSDECWRVRKEVAGNRYGLDVLVNDPHWAVRRAVARQGYGIETLLSDKDERVVEAAREFLKKQAWESELEQYRAERALAESIDGVISKAFDRFENSCCVGPDHNVEVGIDL